MNIVNEIDMQGINTHRDNTVSDMDITGTDKKTDKETKSETKQHKFYLGAYLVRSTSTFEIATPDSLRALL